MVYKIRMQYVGRAFGSVANTWNSLNPATLSGAIDVIVIEQENGDLACSPFHIRFGKFSLLRPSEKKVVCKINDEKVGYPMKVSDGGEAFFVFETDGGLDVPSEMQTSPVISPMSSPAKGLRQTDVDLAEPEFLDLNRPATASPTINGTNAPHLRTITAQSIPSRPHSGDWSPSSAPMDSTSGLSTSATTPPSHLQLPREMNNLLSQESQTRRSRTPTLNHEELIKRATSISNRLASSDLPAKVTDKGDVYLDMTGYKAGKAEAAQAEETARRILVEEVQKNVDLESLIGADEKGNLWIFSSEEAKDQALKEQGGAGAMQFDYEYASDDGRSERSMPLAVTTPPSTPPLNGFPQIQSDKTYVKTLRLTSEQLKVLKLKPGPNSMSFSVNEGKATCTAIMYFWNYQTPIVISDIDGTITKSDALGHVLTMIGRDWTHAGVAKLYTDIANNGYHILYLTSRSVGQADTTRTYLRGIEQLSYKLPQGPVIMSPDRTMAALRREIYLRKPEIFKMACLRDIQHLFGESCNPFYAGFWQSHH